MGRNQNRGFQTLHQRCHRLGVADLSNRGRIPGSPGLRIILERFAIGLLDLPAELWKLAETLPNLHRDPVDRMVVAHAIHADLTLINADRTMREYPVKSLW